ncbi:IS66 family transposase [Myxococcus faecalis]|uniref:IS66 family transposase n=1 Tax=Myxococcus faecalis TaxID=3115646 RepID=UPI003CF79DD8
MDFILELYRVEAQARDADLVGTAAHRALRQESSTRILARLSTWLAVQTPRHPPKSPMGQALSYATKQWEALTRFVDNERLPLDNNRSEAALRKAAMGVSLCVTSSGRCRPLHATAGLARAARAPTSLVDGLKHVCRSQVLRSNLPRSIRHHLLGGEKPTLDEFSNGLVRHAEGCGSIPHGEPAAVLPARGVGWNSGRPSVRSDAPMGPRKAVASSVARLVETYRHGRVRLLASHRTNHRIGVGGGTLAVLSRGGLACSHL